MLHLNAEVSESAFLDLGDVKELMLRDELRMSLPGYKNMEDRGGGE